MAIRNSQPYAPVRLVRQVVSGDLVFWVTDGNGNVVHLLEWGDGNIYLPGKHGMRFALNVHNRSGSWVGLPTFIEGLNVWTQGPNRPEDCTPKHMWEVAPYRTLKIDALMGDAGTGRPFVMTFEEGASVGQAMFGLDPRDDLVGQIVVYERSQKKFRQSGSGTPRAEAAKDVFSGPLSGGALGIGAGEEEYIPSRQTGIQYGRYAREALVLYVEDRADLWPIIARLGTGWAWTSSGYTFNSDLGWQWPQSVPPVTPQIPVSGSGPHRRRENRRDGGGWR